MTMRMQPGIGIAHEPPPADQDAGPAIDAGTWFEAPSPFGPLRLCAFAGGPVRHAAHAAVALHRCEDLLGALHAWTGHALDWRWTETPAPRMAAATHACARWKPRGDGSDPGATPRDLLCLLSLPWALLRRLPPPGGALAACLRWPAVPVVLAVSQFRIGSDELALLEPGGAVVLPDSLRAPWHGVLRTADEPATPGLGVPVALPTPSAPRLVRGDAPPSSTGGGLDDRVVCEVRLAVPHTLPGDRVAGWCDGEALGEVGPHATLWRCATAQDDAACLAGGRLMPWGDGWALAVETVS